MDSLSVVIPGGDQDVRVLGTVDLEGTIVSLGITSSEPPRFDARRLSQTDQVLVQVDAFSCNYRDKSLIVDSASRMSANDWPVRDYFGSEFAGTVVACGDSVRRWKVGDRVMADAAYPGADVQGVPSGIVTNHASSGWVVAHERRLARIPDQMSTEVAAAFSLGAQTAASMIRRAAVREGDRVLVASARSTTSIFLITALNQLGAEVVASSTSSWSPDEMRFVAPALVVGAAEDADRRVPRGAGDFDVVMDPFFDLNLGRTVPLLRMWGRYVTCGMQRQHPLFAAATRPQGTEIEAALLQVVVNNLSIIGNCIGLEHDLASALESYDPAQPRVPVDGVFAIGDGIAFVDGTFNERTKFGKMVMVYSDGRGREHVP